jgi:AMP phosphorylase
MAWRLKKFQEIVAAQGGDKEIKSSKLKLAKFKKDILTTVSGKIKDINNYNLNTIAKILGAPKDKQAGIYLHKKLDHPVKKNEPIMTFYSNDPYLLKEAEVTMENLPIFIIEH